MPDRPSRLSFPRIAILLLGVLVAASAAYAQEDERAQDAYDILQKHCFSCHGGDRQRAGLDLRTRTSVKMGSENGPVIVAHDPKGSRLYQLVSHSERPFMPRDAAKLSDQEIETLRLWIEDGASLEAVDEAADAPTAAPAAASAGFAEREITEEERAYWAFQAARRAPVPAVAHAPAGRAINPIDAFLLASMKVKGLTPSPKADRRNLIRRAYLDVVGLPPTPDEIEAFVGDTSPDAWEKVIDKLLASSHYGERWARHWLDLVRYADSGGFEFDRDRAEGWRYRDYVVNSFNADKPYDRFIKEQIAGDEYSPESAEAMIATGYLRLGPEGGGGGERGRQDQLEDVIATTSATFMGLTVACARCHNHKFDPILQKDYYEMQAIFASTRNVEFPLVPAHEVDAHKAETARIDGLQRPLRQEKTALEAPYLKQLVDAAVAELPEYLQIAWNTPPGERTEGQRLNVIQIEKTLKNDTLRAAITEKDIVALMPDDVRQKHSEVKDRIEALQAQKPKPYATARAIGESGRDARPTYFLYRGSVDAKGPVVTPGILSVLRNDEALSESENASDSGPSAGTNGSGRSDSVFFVPPPEGAKSSWRRRGFAEWLTSPDNPLTARVMVNRLWQHHFGEGLVRTPGNFGKMGEPPSHPELLDWLSLEFVERGWSMKAMHRLMMTSEAYQMASDDIAENAAIDPENRMVWRMPRQRLEAEIIRDNILSVAGSLDRTLGGPSIFPYIDPDLFEESSQRTWPGKPDDDPTTWRRSLYVFLKRSIRYPLFEAFDQPNLINSIDRRNRSTVAPQALLLMNNRFVIVQGGQFAERLKREAGDDVNAQVDRAFQLALGRKPDDVERQRSAEYIRNSPNGLAEFCHLLFNLNEFVYRP